MSPDVVAVVVTFNPAFDGLGRLLDRLRGEVAATVVIDNGSAADVAGWVRGRGASAEQVIALGDNLGIAAAQNRGVAAARAAGARAVILFDQDSLPPAGMIAALLDAARQLEAGGVRLAAVGPTPVDARLRRRQADLGNAAPVPVDHLIASGCLIPLAAFDAVGPLREELFIDYVDIDWCLRAAAHGYRCYRLPGLAMAHEFGAPRTVLGRAFVSHSPMRHYYLFRNSVWLWRLSAVPLGWRLANAPRLLLRLGFNALFATPHLEQWRMMRRGLADGLAGRMGRRHDAVR